MSDSSINKRALAAHAKLRGKIDVSLKDSLDTQDKLSLYYTPGVAAVSNALADDPSQTRQYTWTGNTVAIVSDGSAVLGLGNIGPRAALPVMEGKAMLFKHFGAVNAVPLVIEAHTADDIVTAVKAIAPGFGGINLEDIAAPLCFEVEDRLKAALPIPVFHDDQHGTAIVVLAGLINAIKLSDRVLNDCRVVVSGVGAAGVAIMKLIKLYAPAAQIIGVDSRGIISSGRTDLTAVKQALLSNQTLDDTTSGQLSDALTGADIFIGVSKGNVVSTAMVQSMQSDPILFAMANPTPEIHPNKASKAGVRIMATGRSDFPNQVNNAICFPGIFRGALDNNITTITEAHKIAAAEALAALVEKPRPDYIIPGLHDERVVPAVASVIK